MRTRIFAVGAVLVIAAFGFLVGPALLGPDSGSSETYNNSQIRSQIVASLGDVEGVEGTTTVSGAFPGNTTFETESEFAINVPEREFSRTTTYEVDGEEKTVVMYRDGSDLIIDPANESVPVVNRTVPVPGNATRFSVLADMIQNGSGVTVSRQSGERYKLEVDVSGDAVTKYTTRVSTEAPTQGEDYDTGTLSMVVASDTFRPQKYTLTGKLATQNGTGHFRSEVTISSVGRDAVDITTMTPAPAPPPEESGA